jgi:hypothetical protein
MRYLLIVMILVLAAAMAFPQETGSKELPATKEDIESLFTTMHIREQMRKMIDGMMAQTKQITHENVRKRVPNITQKELDRIDAMADTTMKSYNIDDIFNAEAFEQSRHNRNARLLRISNGKETAEGATGDDCRIDGDFAHTDGEDDGRSHGQTRGHGKGGGAAWGRQQLEALR